MRDLHVAEIRWRKTLRSLKVRYRRPYTTHHSSVSWNLMPGKNPLWVSKQHGHSLITMLRIYAAWTDGAVEADVQVIERSMGVTRTRAPCDRPRKPPRNGGRPSTNETASSLEDLAVVQSVPTTIKGPDEMSDAVHDAKIRPPTACLISENRLRQVWLGWLDSNQRMAGSNGAQENHQLIDSIRLEEPLAHPRIPVAATRAATRPVPAGSDSDLRLMPGLRIINAVITVVDALLKIAVARLAQISRCWAPDA